MTLLRNLTVLAAHEFLSALRDKYPDTRFELECLSDGRYNVYAVGPLPQLQSRLAAFADGWVDSVMAES